VKKKSSAVNSHNILNDLGIGWDIALNSESPNPFKNPKR
jgi:hypothetical protein